MSEDLTPVASQEPPHPLALELAAALAGRSAVRALLLGIGSGRNIAPLLAVDAKVDVIEDDPVRARDAAARYAGEARVRIVQASYSGSYPFAGPFSATLSTHALLHGTTSSVGAAVATVWERLEPGGLFFTTLGSTRDPRFGRGRSIGDHNFAPAAGSEAGVPHVYYDDVRVRTLLEGFRLDVLTEVSAAQSAGRWAHAEAATATMIHWFVRSRKIT